MDDGMLLDALFVTIAVLCLPIGFGRGIVREVFVTAGLLLGSLIGGSWARPWGSDLAELLDVGIDTGQFIVSTAFLVGGVLLFGYAGAAAAKVPAPRRWGRTAGAGLAVGNGAVAVGLILRDIERFFGGTAAVGRIEESEIARVLLREFGWVLVGAAAGMLVLTVVALMVRDKTPPMTPAPSRDSSWPVPAPVPSKRHPRLRWGRDDGKVEPVERGYDVSTGRYAGDAPAVTNTMPVAAVGPASWSMDRALGRPNGYDEWLNVTRPSDEQRAEVTSAGIGEDNTRCASCGERLAPGEAFCPRCGRAR